MWVCKKCGGEVFVRYDEVTQEEYRVNKEGRKKGKKLNTLYLGNHGEQYFCDSCDNKTEYYCDNINNIAEWEIQRKGGAI